MLVGPPAGAQGLDEEGWLMGSFRGRVGWQLAFWTGLGSWSAQDTMVVWVWLGTARVQLLGVGGSVRVAVHTFGLLIKDSGFEFELLQRYLDLSDRFMTLC